MSRTCKKHRYKVREAVKIVELLGSHYSLLRNSIRPTVRPLSHYASAQMGLAQRAVAINRHPP